METRRGLDFFGYSKNDLARGINISELFPDELPDDDFKSESTYQSRPDIKQ